MVFLSDGKLLVLHRMQIQGALIDSLSSVALLLLFYNIALALLIVKIFENLMLSQFRYYEPKSEIPKIYKVQSYR